MLTMPKASIIMISPTMAQVIFALAAATACLSPLEYAHWMPPQTIIRTETAMPAIKKMLRELPMIFAGRSALGCGIPAGTATGLPPIERERSSFIRLCFYHTKTI